MISEKNAQKREEASATAALCATKPIFTKMGHGMDYLQETVRQTQKANLKQAAVVNQRQYETERYVGKLIEEQDTIRQSIETSKEIQQAQNTRLDQRLSNIEQKTMLRCQSCGAIISPVQIVCHHCGNISAVFPYDLQKFGTNPERETSYLEEIKVLSNAVHSSSLISEDTYPELQNYINQIQKIASIAKTHIDNRETEDDSTVYKRIYRKCRQLLSDLHTAHIEIAIVGNVKAGKSSLINALLGAKMASVDPTPETSVLVKYHTTSSKNYIRVEFYTEKQWERLWLDVGKNSTFRQEYEAKSADNIRDQYLGKSVYYEECSFGELPEKIMKWTSSETPEHFFVRELEVGYHRSDYQDSQLPNDVILVDTPGLRDPIAFRSKITKKYIKNADWVLVCISSENLCSQDEARFLGEITANNGQRADKILVVATKRDMLPAKEYDAKQKDFLERFKEFYSGRMGLAIDHFIPVSAETSMLLNAYLKNSTGLSDEDDEKFFSALNRLRIRNPADIVQRKPDIIEYAGINALSMRLDKMILKGRKTEIIASAKEKYRKTMEFIRGAATEAFTAECKDFCTIVDESEDYQRQLDSLNDFIREAQETQREIGALRMKLAEVLQKQTASTVKD